MERSKKKLLEYEVNDFVSKKIQDNGLLVLQRLRLHPTELDIVLFDPNTLLLANLEIKRANWRKVLLQTIRAKLYCHFSIAVMPRSISHVVPEELFAQQGIGIIFYEQSDDEINLIASVRPRLSNSINRLLKQIVYRKFYDHYGDMVYDRYPRSTSFISAFWDSEEKRIFKGC